MLERIITAIENFVQERRKRRFVKNTLRYGTHDLRLAVGVLVEVGTYLENRNPDVRQEEDFILNDAWSEFQRILEMSVHAQRWCDVPSKHVSAPPLYAGVPLRLSRIAGLAASIKGSYGGKIHYTDLNGAPNNKGPVIEPR